MKKIVKTKKPQPYKQEPEKLNIASEPEPVYRTVKKVIPSLKDFTYIEFKKNADRTPFTQAEWAAMLHVSERTLQRYAKNNGTFSFINAERFHQIMQVVERGKKVFGKTELFYQWLHSNPPMLEGDLSAATLTTYDGIQKTLTQLGRIEHGIFA